MIKRSVYPDTDAVARALASDLLALFESTGKSTSPTAAMLAGGRTPRTAYQQAAASRQQVPAALHFMVSDERWVPADHPDSNLFMMRPFLEAVQCGNHQRIMVDTSLSPEQSAADFGRRLDGFFAAGGKLMTAYLGLGADGHTASLFTDDDLSRAETASAISVNRPDGRIGISATPRIIRKAERIVFVVTGEEKREVAERLLSDPQSMVAGKVVFRHPQVELWLDQAASSPA